MAEKKTYVALVAHEHVKRGDVVYTEASPRMEALLGAGYYAAADVTDIRVASAAYLDVPDSDPGAEDDWVDTIDDDKLLERFEELDVVEVVTEKPKRVTRKQ